MPDRARLLAEARFLGIWGHLLQVDADEAEILEAVEEQLPGELGRLAAAFARALAEGSTLSDALGDATCLSSWVQVLLAAEPRHAARLQEASAHQALEATQPWRRGWVWKKLGVLHRADASLGDGLGSLAREARDHGLTALAEGLYAAAREARKGAVIGDILGALTGVTPSEALALRSEADLDATLETLEQLGAFDEHPSQSEPASALDSFAQAANEKAAPIKRGFDRFLSGIEGALGIDRGPSPRAELARQAVEARARRDTPNPSPDPQTTPAPTPAPPPSHLADLDPLEKVSLHRAAKTIGSDSAPVDVSALVHDPDLETWAVAFDEASAKQALLDVQPGEAGVARELAAELKTLRADLRGSVDTPTRRGLLDELEMRFIAWSNANSDS